MYTLAVIALLALALAKLVDVVEDLAPAVAPHRALVTLVLAVAAVTALDYSVFAGFKVHFRADWMATAATGLVLAGATGVWRALLGWLGTTEDGTSEARPVRSGGRPRIAA
jgi:hypothetical protein